MRFKFEHVWGQVPKRRGGGGQREFRVSTAQTSMTENITLVTTLVSNKKKKTDNSIRSYKEKQSKASPCFMTIHLFYISLQFYVQD